MKDWKSVALWAFILISGELILYGRYYILFYKPYVPFKLVRALHSKTLGIRPEDERYGWYYTVQYVGNDTLEDVTISWDRYTTPFISKVVEETRHIEYLPYGETFIVSGIYKAISFTITYHKGTEVEEIEIYFGLEDAVEVIPEQTPDPDPLSFKKPEAHARAATAFPQILAVISLLIGAVLMSYFIFSIARKDRR